MIAGTFNEWFTLQRKARTADNQGSFTMVWTTCNDAVRGRMSRAGRQTSLAPEVREAAQLQEWEIHIFYCRADAGVKRGDQVIDSSGVVYLVLAIRTPSQRPANHMECQCREVQQGA